MIAQESYHQETEVITPQVESEAQRKAGELKQKTLEAREKAAAQAKESAARMANELKEKARNAAHGQKENVASHIDNTCNAIRAAATKLKEDSNLPVADNVNMAADQLSNISSYIRSTDPGEMVKDVESFARRQPLAVFGGLFLLGLGASRFLKASPSSNHTATVNS